MVFLSGACHRIAATVVTVVVVEEADIVEAEGKGTKR